MMHNKTDVLKLKSASHVEGPGANAIDIVLIVVAVKMMGFPGTLSPYFGQSGTILNFVIYPGMFLVVVAAIINKGRHVLLGKIAFPQMTIVVFLFCIFLSGCFGAFAGKVTAVNALKLAILASFALVVVYSLEWTKIIKDLFIAVAFVVVASFCVMLIPGIGYRNYQANGTSFTGLWSTKNNCAGLMAFSIVFTSLCITGKTKVFCAGKRAALQIASLALLLLLEAVMLIASNGIGGIACVIASLLFVFFGDRIVLTKNLGAAYIALYIAFAIVVFYLTPAIAPYLSQLDRSTDLTGRTDIWQGIARIVSERNILFGLGYDGDFWSEGTEAFSAIQSVYLSLGMYTINNGGHNAFMEILLQSGVVGLASFLLMVVSVFSGFGFIRESSISNWVLAFFIFFSVYGLTESLMAYSSWTTLFLFVAIGFIVRYGHIDDSSKPKGRDFCSYSNQTTWFEGA